MNKLFFFAYIICLLSLTACTASDKTPSPIMPVMQPINYSEPAPTYSNPGSLYSVDNPVDLYADSRARRVGDIVLVNIDETSTAYSDADTNTSKVSESTFGISAFFGKTSLPVIGSLSENLLTTNSDNTFEGNGDTSRNSNIYATVASRVVRVFPNGILQVEGIRETRVNGETQYIVVMGLVRMRDIDANNSVSSSQMADAQIQIYGSGIISDKQKPGWLSRLLDTLNPF